MVPLRFPPVLAVSLGLIPATSCGGGDLVLPTESQPAQIEIAGGDGQTGAAGSPLPDSITVLVRDALDRPIRGVQVGFSLGGGAAGGEVAPAAALTGADGMAGARWVLGGTAGTQEVVAGVLGGDLSVRFSATAQSAEARAVFLVSGNGQEAPVGTALPDSLVVRVTDAFGNPVAAVVVQWSASAGSVSPTEAVTRSNGLAAARRILGSAAGEQTATAAAPGLDGSPVTFTHTAVPGTAATLVLVSGDGQTGVPGAELADPLVVRLVDEQGNGIPGRAVAWVVSTGDGSAAPPSSDTDGDGFASSRWTLGAGLGPQTMTAVVSGVGFVTFSATASAGPAVLAFAVQPSDVQRRKRFEPLVQVSFAEDGVKIRIELLDSQGNPTEGLRGHDTRDTKNGVALFDDLNIDREGTGYLLRASAPDRPEVASVLSVPFDVTH